MVDHPIYQNQSSIRRPTSMLPGLVRGIASPLNWGAIGALVFCAAAWFILFKFAEVVF